MAERYPQRKEISSSLPGNGKTDESDKPGVSNWRSEGRLSRSNAEEALDWRKDGERSGQGSENPWRISLSSSLEPNMPRPSSGYQTCNQRQDIYGGATPVDTRKKDEELERKWKAQEFQVSKKSGAKGRKLEEELSRSKEAPNYVDKNPFSELAKKDDDDNDDNDDKSITDDGN